MKQSSQKYRLTFCELLLHIRFHHKSLSIIPKEYHERFEDMIGLIYDMNHEQNYSYYRAGIKLAAEIFLEALKDEE